MTELEDVHKALKKYKDLLNSKDKESFENDYNHGFYNGLELALSLLEERPVFYKNLNKQFRKEDMLKYPEYFL
jgi:hypothetical protein